MAKSKASDVKLSTTEHSAETMQTKQPMSLLTDSIHESESKDLLDDIDAISLLKADHQKVAALFEQFKSSASQEKKAAIVVQLCLELVVHTQLEEEIFYPACREHNVECELLDEAQVEHDGAKIMINELLASSPSSEFYDAKVKVLSEYINHHVAEEEKPNGIFVKALAAGLDATVLGGQLQSRRAELMSTINVAGIHSPPTPSLTLHDQSSSVTKFLAEEQTPTKHSRSAPGAAHSTTAHDRDAHGYTNDYRRFIDDREGTLYGSSYARGENRLSQQNSRGWHSDSQEYFETASRRWKESAISRAQRTRDFDQDRHSYGDYARHSEYSDSRSRREHRSWRDR